MEFAMRMEGGSVRRALLVVAGVVTAVMVNATAIAQSPPGVPTRQPPAPFFGSVPVGTATAEPLTLTVLDAINRALEHNLGVLLSDDAKGRAAGARWKALGGLLPNIGGRLSETRQIVDLAAYGFPLPEGIPPIVGPFNLFDARVYITQPIVDLRAINDMRAEQHNVAAAAHTYRGARELVVLVAANAYLQALAAAARADSARAQSQTAQALYDQA